jgi:hypothetical protein
MCGSVLPSSSVSHVEVETEALSLKYEGLGLKEFSQLFLPKDPGNL